MKPPASHSHTGLRKQLLIGTLSGIVMLAGTGCASYFRTGEMSLQQLKERNQEQQRPMMFKPGSVLYTQ